MNNIQNHIKKIIDAKNNNRLVIFVGSGISKNSETNNSKIPNWSELIENLKQDLGKIKENDYLKIAQLYYLEYGECEYYNKIKNLVNINLEPCCIHELIFKIQPQHIITTNWDNLLEKQIENDGLIYDIVSSDENLVKSNYPKKLIKMHGDFSQHNIVFKEDDYLTYSQNFSLIENYIKGILSTNVVLFLGYSYSDYNLKQITKWIQNIVKNKPLSYLCVTEYNKIEEKYLEAHGIKALDISDNKKSIKTVYKEFLEKIINDNYISTTLDLDKKCSFEDAINFIYEKLKVLKSLKILLPSQITLLLKYTTISIDNQNVIIQSIYSGDNYFSSFFNEIKNKDKIDNLNKDIRDKYDGVINIFSRAGITLANYIIDNKLKKKKIYICYEDIEYINNIISFNFDNLDENNLYSFYFEKNYEKAYEFHREKLKKLKKDKNYIFLFICMNNINNLLEILKIYNHEKYKNIKKYDIEEEYIGLPKSVRLSLSPVLNLFKNNDYIYRLFFEVQKNSNDIDKMFEINKNGGFYHKNNIGESKQKLKNLIYFVIANELTVDLYTEFEDLINSLILSIFRLKMKISEIELFCIIKYFKSDNILEILKEYDNNFMKNNDLIEYLFTVFKNLTKKYNSNAVPDNLKNFNVEIVNVIYLISHCDIKNNKQIKEFIEDFKSLIQKPLFLNTYQAISYLFYYQNDKYNNSFCDGSDLKQFLEIILKKFSAKDGYNGHDLVAISTYGYLNNIVNSFSNTECKFDNIELLALFLEEMNKLNINDKINFIMNFLTVLYNVSDDSNRNTIKQFITSIDYEENKDISNELKIKFEIYLFVNEFKNNIEFSKLKKDINELIFSYKSQKSFDSKYNNFCNYLKSMSEKDSKFKDLYDNLEQVIKDKGSLFKNIGL